MTSTSPMALYALGATCALGYTFRAAQPAMAAGMAAFAEVDMEGNDGERVVCSTLEGLGSVADRSGRIRGLVHYALSDLVASLDGHPLDGLPVILGIDGERRQADLDAFRDGMDATEGASLDLRSPVSGVVAQGRLSFLVALSRAHEALTAGRAPAVVVGAADTRCDPDTLAELRRGRRLLNSRDDGTIPGEAAVFALLARVEPRSATSPRLLVHPPSFRRDDPAVLYEAPARASGLAEAFAAQRTAAEGRRRPMAVVSFETGEGHYTRAFMTAYLRNVELMPEPLEHVTIASTVGDCGAAAGGMALVHADWLLRWPEPRPGDSVLTYGHADDGGAGAVVFAYGDGGRP